MWWDVNRGLNAVFNLYLWPFKHLSSTWQVCALAVPAAGIALLVYRYTSNQELIQKTKDKLKAYLLELLIFKDDLNVMLHAQGRILRYSLTYMRLALVPMAVMVIPFVVFLIQVESRFAYGSLTPGDTTVLSVQMNSGGSVSQMNAQLLLPDALRQETPALRIDSTEEILWRIRALALGDYSAAIKIGDQNAEKRILVGLDQSPVSPAVYRADDVRTLLYPGEPALSSDRSIEVIRVEYPRVRATFAGLSSASWIFFGMTILLGFALRGLFGVTF